MKKQILLLFVTLLSITAFAQKAKKLENTIAIKGYDPVAYFQENKAVKGNQKIASVQNNKTYYFASEENKALFIKNPVNYEPQYAGYCAYGMSENHEAPIEPEAFTIVDNKLYLNYNIETRTAWQKQQKERISKANTNWSTFKK